MKLYEGGVYLVNGHDIVEENSMTQPVSREEAAKIRWHMEFWKLTILPVT